MVHEQRRAGRTASTRTAAREGGGNRVADNPGLCRHLTPRLLSAVMLASARAPPPLSSPDRPRGRVATGRDPATVDVHVVTASNSHRARRLACDGLGPHVLALIVGSLSLPSGVVNAPDTHYQSSDQNRIQNSDLKSEAAYRTPRCLFGKTVYSSVAPYSVAEHDDLQGVRLYVVANGSRVQIQAPR